MEMPADYANRTGRRIVIAVGIALALLSAAVAQPGPLSSVRAERQFVFGAAGDFGYHVTDSDPETREAWTSMGNGGLDFVLAVGDFSYDETDTGTWCSNFKSHIPNVVVISGNHDASSIDGFAAACPFTLGQMTGDYGKRFYFDYPQPNPLARFILISPDIFGSYSAGDADYTWTAEAIDGARSAGIPWVIMAMHKVCITTGSKSCQIGPDVLNLFLEKRVDLVLAGHDHDYQRSKSLAHSDSCPTLSPDSFNAACVAASGPTYPSGNGTVLVIQGTGGQGTDSVSSSDPEAGYFDSYTACCHGFVKYQVSESAIEGVFVNDDAPGFTDSFSIGPRGSSPGGPDDGNPGGADGGLPGGAGGNNYLVLGLALVGSIAFVGILVYIVRRFARPPR